MVCFGWSSSSTAKPCSRRADDRLSPHRDREDRRAEEVAAGDSARRAHGLSERAVQQHGVLPVGGDAARARGAGAGAIDSRPHRRAPADQQPSRLARHPRHGGRRRVGDAVLLPGARAAAEHQRDARRLPDVPELHARRRAPRRSAARVPRRGAGVPRSLSAEARRIRGPADPERDLSQAHPRRRHDLEGRRGGARPRRPDCPGGRRRLRRPQGVSVSRLRDVRVRRADADQRRRLRALPGPGRRDARKRQDLPSGARAHFADGRLGRRRSAHHAAAEGPRLYRDGSAHSALPDLLAGIYRAGRRSLRAGRRTARRAWVLHRRRTAPIGRGASNHAPRRFSPARRSRR